MNSARGAALGILIGVNAASIAWWVGAAAILLAAVLLVASIVVETGQRSV